MSIVALRRVTLFGLTGEKAETLEALQTLGVLHLVPLRKAAPLAVTDPTAIRRAETAFKHLKGAAEQALPYPSDKPCDEQAVIGQVFENRTRLQSLRERRDFLTVRIEMLAPWGDLTFPPLDEMGGRRLWFYALPARDRATLSRLQLPWQIIQVNGALMFVVVVSPEEPADDCLPIPRVHTGSVARSALKRELGETLIAIDQAEAERVELTRWRLVFGARLAAVADREDLALAEGQALEQDQIFAVQGWAPEEALPAIEALAAERGLALETAAPGPEDHPPTLLRPPEAVAGGADLTRSYTNPGYRAWDPSATVFWSFSLFFAMIIADAGYAAVIALVTAACWTRLGLSPGGRRARNLMAAISAVSVLYGVICGSYFGLALAPGSLPARLAIVDVNNFGQMMALSILVGAAHITIALSRVAWINRRGGAGLTALGWIVALWSGIALLLGAKFGEKAFSGSAYGGVGVAIGLAAVALGAMIGGTQRNVFLRLASGLLALTSVTKLFGDVLSYLRLFALGLASASLATTFNTLAGEVRLLHPGLGVVFALLVLTFGHGINFLLGLMSGAVHGLRLNFIEFFSWGLPEEGYPFRPFARRETSGSTRT